MMRIGQALEDQAAPPRTQPVTRGRKVPRCCGREMLVLLRRALLHRDGSVEFQEAWECHICGRRIL